MSFFQELKRRNVFRVAVAYAVVGWLLVEVASVLFETFEAPAWVMKVFATIIALGFPLALFFAWAYELTPEGLKKEKDVDRSQTITHRTGRKLDYLIIGLLSVAVVFFASTHQWGSEREIVDKPAITEAAAGGERSIAVLPFVNMSDDPANEYFSDGIAEELLNVLVKVEGLRVASRTSSFSFKGKGISIPNIARELNVNHVLEGSVRKAGNTVRITAQLIDVRTDRHLWSATYDRELEDIFAIQDEISGKIVQALKVALGSGEQQAMAHVGKPTENVEAYELYLQGRYFWQRRGEDNIRRSIALFEQATELDPQFARAWSSLAAAHTTLPAYSDETGHQHNPPAVLAAQRALTLDDSLAEAYAVLGDIARVERKWMEAKAYYERAIASEPKNSTAHLWYGEHHATVGHMQEAFNEVLIAHQLDPLHPATNAHLADLYLWKRDTSNALKYARTAWDLGYNAGLRIQMETNLFLGDFGQALAVARQFDNTIEFPVGVAELYVEARMDALKRGLFLETLAEYETMLPFRVLLTSYADFDRLDDAYRVTGIGWQSAGANTWWNLWEDSTTTFRQDPRFADLVTRLGLVDYWRENGWPDACRPMGDSLGCE